MESKQFKTVLRTIIREELEYFFSKIEKRLNENSVTRPTQKLIKTQTLPQTVKGTVKPQQQKSTNLKSKFMQMISEGFNEEDLDTMNSEEPKSILEEGMVQKLKNSSSKSLKTVGDALTKDYSSMLKKIDQIKTHQS
jgi:hypothetical protein